MCGAVRYEADGEPFHATLCHCVDCRRASGAPALAWFSVRRAALRVTTCSLDDPDAVPPADHTFHAQHVRWLHLADKLPRFPRLRSDGVNC